MAYNYATIIATWETEAASLNTTPPNTMARVASRLNSIRTMIVNTSTAMNSPSGSVAMTQAEIARAYAALNSFGTTAAVNQLENGVRVGTKIILDGIIAELRAVV